MAKEFLHPEGPRIEQTDHEKPWLGPSAQELVDAGLVKPTEASISAYRKLRAPIPLGRHEAQSRRIANQKDKKEK